jgi:hypothetical protein
MVRIDYLPYALHLLTAASCHRTRRRDLDPGAGSRAPAEARY